MSFNNGQIINYIFNPIVFPIDKSQINSFGVEINNLYNIVITVYPLKQMEMFIEDKQTNKRAKNQCSVYMKHKYGSTQINTKYFGNEIYEKVNYQKIINECSNESKEIPNEEIIYYLYESTKYMVFIKEQNPFYIDIQSKYILLYF